MSETASKHDGEKPRLHLVPNELVYGAARAFGFGAKKYARYNWMRGMEWTRLRDAVERHLRAWNDGEELDPESGLSHLDHAAASLAMLMGHVGRGYGRDDRHCTTKDPDKPEKPAAVATKWRLPRDPTAATELHPAEVNSVAEMPCSWCRMEPNDSYERVA